MEEWNTSPFSHEAIQTVQVAAAMGTPVQHPRQQIWRISDEVCLNILSALLQACGKHQQEHVSGLSEVREERKMQKESYAYYHYYYISITGQ